MRDWEEPMDMTERARELVERYWDQLLELDPLLGTFCGDERHDDRLSDPGPEGRAASEAVHRSALSESAAFERDGLGVVERTSLDVLEAVAHRHLSELEHRTDRLMAANHLWGPGQLVGEIASIQQVDSPERLDRYEARLRALPAYLEATAEVADEGIRTGVTSPRLVVERSIAQVERLLETNPERSPALMGLGEDAGAKERIAGVVREVVAPAYDGYLGMLRDYLPHATETIGLSALPGGEEIYAAQIRNWTSLPLGPQEVHDLGNERFEAIQQERFDLAAKLGFASPKEALTAHRASGANTPASPEALLQLAEDQVRRSWEAAPSWFGRLPSQPCEVRAVEAFREADMPAAFYNPPTEDGSRQGVYYINTYDLENRDIHIQAGVSFHEANPGHHFQVTLEQEFLDRPRLRRFGGILAGSAFIEGWGLYSERLADEMGLYADDWERLGMLENQGLRAARLITDTGIHALGWTREAAIAKLEEIGAFRTEAEIEVDRYIAMPGQAVSYMIGMIQIERARAAAEARDGADFSLSDFHDRLLGLGSIPLPSLTREL